MAFYAKAFKCFLFPGCGIAINTAGYHLRFAHKEAPLKASTIVLGVFLKTSSCIMVAKLQSFVAAWRLH